MTTFAEVREDLAAAASACGREVYAYQPDTVISGSGFVSRREFDPRLIFSQAKAERLFTITFAFNRTSERSAAEAIDELCELSGAGSLIGAVQDENNWSVAVDYALVTRVGEMTVQEQDGVAYLTVDFDIEVVW